MKRRNFVYLSAVAAISLPTLLRFRPGESLINILKKPAFLSQILSESILLEIGKAYKLMTPSEKSNDDKLVKLLLTGRKGKSYLQTLDKEAISLFIDEKIKQDMKTQNTMIVNGWIISLTETRQCALLAN